MPLGGSPCPRVVAEATELCGGLGSGDAQGPALLSGKPKGNPGPSLRGPVMHTMQFLSHCPPLKPEKQNERRKTVNSTVWGFGPTKGRGASYRVLSTKDLILVHLAEKPEAHCPQLVQVSIIVPLGAGADLHTGAKVLVGPSQFAIECMGPATRPSGTQRNPIPPVFSEHLIHPFRTWVLSIYPMPDARPGGGRRTGQRAGCSSRLHGAHRLARKTEAQELHEVRADGQRSTRRKQRRAQ